MFERMRMLGLIRELADNFLIDEEQLCDLAYLVSKMSTKSLNAFFRHMSFAPDDLRAGKLTHEGALMWVSGLLNAAHECTIDQNNDYPPTRWER